MVDNYVVGIDYGSDSVRAVVVDSKCGRQIASAVQCYPRWSEGLYCDPSKNQYRQHPLDYIESLESVMAQLKGECGESVMDNIRAISFDTTCSTPVVTNSNGTPLSLLERYVDNPNAMFVLWKDHTALDEADQINSLSKAWTVDYTKYSGGIYSCEWVWAKVLHCLREDESIRESTYSWIEHCDWIGALLTGNTKPEKVIRSRCAAGHKAMWHESWGGLPSEEFLATLDPLLSGLRGHLYSETYTNDTQVGKLTPLWAERLALREGIAVGLGSIDCHIGAIGAGISPNILVKTIGTSTCDILITNGSDSIVPGICGEVDGSVIPGYIGMEAGQSAFGDVYAWFKELMCWPLKHLSADAQGFEAAVIAELTKQAMELGIDDSIPLSLDWMNGRRTPDANQRVKGAICDLTLSSSAPAIFASLVQATAFGSRAIAERLNQSGICIEGVIALGGIAVKSPYVMQTLADVMGFSIKVAKGDQTCAFGAAMCASVAAGIHSSISKAQESMGQGFDAEYMPDPKRHSYYNERYKAYLELGDFVERSNRQTTKK